MSRPSRPTLPIQVNALRFSYPAPAGPIEVLRGLDLEVAPGQSLAIVGPSGSGKSTLLHILGTLEQPTSGSVRMGDTDPFGLDPRALAQFRNQTLGFVFQDHHLLPQYSLLENVLLPTLASPKRTPAAKARGQALLERVGLGHRLQHRPAELSGGERQRAAIARALICDPPLLLADEPTGNLDQRAADEVADLLLELAHEGGGTLLLVTHAEALAHRCQRRVRLVDGHLQELA